MLTVVLVLLVSVFGLSALTVSACMMSARISARENASGYEEPLRNEAARLAPVASPSTRVSVAK
jgi:hypothetical protein